jgi:hypothetical protein
MDIVDVDLPYPDFDISKEENERRECCSLFPFAGLSKDEELEFSSHPGSYSACLSFNRVMVAWKLGLNCFAQLI